MSTEPEPTTLPVGTPVREHPEPKPADSGQDPPPPVKQ